MKLNKFINYDVGMLIIRIGFGVGFIAFHGWGKLTGGPERWEKIGSVMSDIGINFGHTFFGFLAAFAESIGALCIAFGFQMQLFSLMLAFTMFMASWYHIFGKGSPANALKYLFIAVGLFFLDPGKYSVDHWLKSKK